jgi:signal transduction histidine kinase
MAIGAMPSPLATAVLALVREGATAADLVARLAADDAIVDEGAATARLDELAHLGLIRVVSAEPARTYRVTPLGERILRMSFAADTRHVDLLADIERMRTEILSVIAHEMRTPLTAVRTSVGLLLDPAIEPDIGQRRTLLETIDRNASRMQRVVGDILDLARFRAGRVQLQLRRFDATELARSAIASVEPLAEARDQTIELLEPPRRVSIFGDFQRLEQALVNLLSNAGKYSPAGTRIRVTVSAADDEVTWSVADEGRGIEPDDQARLFERFFVASRDRTESVTGIGLGLPIALLIAQSHGGRIDVESTPARGSTFRLVVPAAGPEGVPPG